MYTHCDLTPSNRVAMIAALTEKFPVDSRGFCLRNKPPIDEDGSELFKYDRKGHHNKVTRMLVFGLFPLPACAQSIVCAGEGTEKLHV